MVRLSKFNQVVEILKEHIGESLSASQLYDLLTFKYPDTSFKSLKSFVLYIRRFRLKKEKGYYFIEEKAIKEAIEREERWKQLKR